MWQYNSTDELYHFGIKGMRWGHRKEQISNFTKSAFKMDVDDIKTKLKNIKRLKSQTEQERKQILQDRAKQYGYKTASTVNTAKHVSSAVGKAYMAKWIAQYGAKTIKSYTEGRDVEKWRMAAAFAMVAIPSIMYAASSAKEIGQIKKDNEIQKEAVSKRR